MVFLAAKMFQLAIVEAATGGVCRLVLVHSKELRAHQTQVNRTRSATSRQQFE